MSDPTSLQINRIRRLAIGAGTDDTTLPDEDVIALWNEGEGGNGNVYLTAAACCEMLAASIALKIPQWSADGQSVNRSLQPGFLEKRAAILRRDYYGGGTSGTLTITRSEDEDDLLGTEYTKCRA